MRKILIGIVVGLLLIGSAFFMINGISKINIVGIKGLEQKEEKIDEKIKTLSNAISVTYTNTESNLKRTASTLQESKTEYENQAILSNSQSPTYVSNVEKYDIDYLWTKLGNYARSEKVVIKIDLVSGGASQKLYNLNFTVTGDYVNITDFIYDIENDSKLGFKIDDFKMTGSDNGLTSTFTCKDVPIEVGKVDQSGSTTTTQEQANSSTTSENTTNETNTPRSTNTTGNTSTSETSAPNNTSATTATQDSAVSTH